MSILGEVQVAKLKCLQQFPQDNGLTEVFEVECWMSGNAQGKVQVRASIHVRTATFNDEKWKLITLMCSHYAYPAHYTQLFAPSCGSIGDFTDIMMDADGKLAITNEMQNYSFPVRRLNGEFYAHVYPFHTKFYRKVTLREHCCFRDFIPILLCFNIYAFICQGLDGPSGSSLKCPNIG